MKGIILSLFLIILSTKLIGENNPPVSRYAGYYLVLCEKRPKFILQLLVRPNGDIHFYRREMNRTISGGGFGECNNYGLFWIPLREGEFRGRLPLKRDKSLGYVINTTNKVITLGHLTIIRE